MAKVDLHVQLVKGPKPSALDAMCEASSRGYRFPKNENFLRGAMNECHGRPNIPVGSRAAEWQRQGAEWAATEIARRSSAA